MSKFLILVLLEGLPSCFSVSVLYSFRKYPLVRSSGLGPQGLFLFFYVSEKNFMSTKGSIFYFQRSYLSKITRELSEKVRPLSSGNRNSLIDIHLYIFHIKDPVRHLDLGVNPFKRIL